MKKVTSVFLFIIMVFAMFSSTAFAAATFDGDINEKLPVVLIDADSGKVLYEQHADEIIKPASTTKILTCLVAIENGNLSDTVTVSKHAAGISGSQLEIKSGEEFVLRDLLIGMMMKSGNDAAMAVAEHIGESEEGFVSMMNELASEIGMTSSHFVNPHGKDNDEHVVSARDMALLGQYAMHNQTFMELIDRESFELPKTNKQGERTIPNFDSLVKTDSEYYYPYATGMKTGSTTGAGGCLVASATKDRQNLVCVVFGDTSYNKTERWDIVKKLFDFGFDNYSTIDILSLVDNNEPITAQVENYASNDIYEGTLEFLQPMPDQRYVTLDKETAQAITDGTDTIEMTRVYYEEPLTAPVYENDVVGEVIYKSASTGTEIGKGFLIASRDVLEGGGTADSIGESAVVTMPPKAMEELEKEKAWDKRVLFILLLIPAALIIFLIIRVVTVKRKKRRKYRRKNPTYSYKIRK